MIEVGKMIAAFRIDRGLSQQQLADKVDLSKQAISNYERGIREPPYVVLEALARELHVSVAALLAQENEKAALSALYDEQTQKNKTAPQVSVAPELSQEDRRLLAAYHAADPSARQFALEMLENHPAKTEDRRHA